MNSLTDPFPELLTENCRLRKIVDADQQKIFEGLSHPEVIRYYGVSYTSFDATKAQMEFYNDLIVNNSGIWWAIALKDAGTFIGATGYNNWSKEHCKAELGFWLLPAFQRKGYMKESVKVVTEFGFTKMNLHRIEAIAEKGNESSASLLTKCGFLFEGTHKECEIKNGRFIDLDFYALLSPAG